MFLGKEDQSWRLGEEMKMFFLRERFMWNRMCHRSHKINIKTPDRNADRRNYNIIKINYSPTYGNN
jgi:hypothetical protein